MSVCPSGSCDRQEGRRETSPSSCISVFGNSKIDIGLAKFDTLALSIPSYCPPNMSEIATVSLPKLACGLSLVGLALIDLLCIMFRFVWGIIRAPEEKKGLPLSNLAIILMNALFVILFAGSLASAEGWISF